MVSLHLKKHGGDAENSLAEIPVGLAPPARSWPDSATRRLTPPWPAPAPAPVSPRRTTTLTAPPATPSAQRPQTASGFGSSAPTPEADSVPSSWRWTPSCIARWRSSRSSTITPTTRAAAAVLAGGRGHWRTGASRDRPGLRLSIHPRPCRRRVRKAKKQWRCPRRSRPIGARPSFDPAKRSLQRTRKPLVPPVRAPVENSDAQDEQTAVKFADMQADVELLQLKCETLRSRVQHGIEFLGQLEDTQ